jgi:membrane-associated phospholipid phosphatase
MTTETSYADPPDRRTFADGTATEPVETAASAGAESDPHRRAVDRTTGGFDTTWPVKGAEAVRLLVAAIVVVGTGIVIGFVLTDWAAPNSITRLDERIADWFVGTRTEALTSFSPVAAFPADTFPKIIISTIICGFFVWRWRRWHDAVYVALPLVFEALCFITITSVVQRPRPEVDQLIHSTIDSSYPSGHVAAATVYVAVVIVVFRHTTAIWARVLAVGLFVIVAVGVYWARLYQGVHFASDVLAGIVLGAVSVIVTDRVLRRRHHHPDPR